MDTEGAILAVDYQCKRKLERPTAPKSHAATMAVKPMKIAMTALKSDIGVLSQTLRLPRKALPFFDRRQRRATGWRIACEVLCKSPLCSIII
jgi:hypothetical protein